jgi:hypothetical protein
LSLGKFPVDMNFGKHGWVCFTRRVGSLTIRPQQLLVPYCTFAYRHSNFTNFERSSHSLALHKAKLTRSEEAAERAVSPISTGVKVHYILETSYDSTSGVEFNMLRPENAMKWEALRPDAETFAFASPPTDRHGAVV